MKKFKPLKGMTLGVVALPSDHQAIGVKWMSKIKKNAESEMERYKVGLAIKGCKQKQRVD